MFNTRDVKTKTEIIERRNPAKEGTFPLGVDIGYSSVKGMSPNKVFCFPAYAKKIPEGRTILREPKESDIFYRDETGTWVVGDLAYDEVSPSDVIDSEEELYGRNHYYSMMFKVITRTAYGIGLSDNKFGGYKGKKLSVQTGLPPKYEKQDTPILKEVMSGAHDFSLKVGKEPWKRFQIMLSENDIYVMSQPLASFMSACIDANGRQLSIAKDFFNKHVVIFDPGFGTSDIYALFNGRTDSFETFTDLGMCEVFRRTIKEIERFGKSVQIPELQNYLDKGRIKVVSRKKGKLESKTYSFAPILKRCLDEVEEENIEKMLTLYKSFEGIDVLIVTGGLGDCWYTDILEKLSGLEEFQVIPANINDPSLSNVFSNARGYYMFLCNQM